MSVPIFFIACSAGISTPYEDQLTPREFEGYPVPIWRRGKKREEKGKRIREGKKIHGEKRREKTRERQR